MSDHLDDEVEGQQEHGNVSLEASDRTQYLGSTLEVASDPSTLHNASSSGERKDKGKGKATEVESGERADDKVSNGNNIGGARSGSNEASVERAKQDLRNLARLDPDTAERLVGLDPTPVTELLTTTKIMKAISILTSSCSIMQEMNNEYEAPNGFPLSIYSDLVELLSSALSDISQSNPTLRSPPKPISLHQLEVARAKLSLPLKNAVPPQGQRVEGLVAVSPAGRSLLLGASPAPPSELALLMAENARLALAALRPPSLFPSRDYGSVTPASAMDTSRAASPPVGPSYIAKLPSELLLYILQFAHSAAAEHDDTQLSNQPHASNHAPMVTEVWNGRGRRSLRDQYGNPLNGITGSKGAAQRFTLSLARVCKAWVEPSRTVAFRHLYLQQAPQLADLLSLLETSPSLRHATSSIQSISATLSPPGSDEPPVPGGPQTAALNRMIGRIVGRRGRPASPSVSFGGRSKSDKEGSSGGAGGKAEEGKSPAENWSQIVEQSPNVRKLKLRILPSSGRWAGFSRTPTTTEFLDAAVLGTLSSTHSLKNLNLVFSIDFEELEVIMNGLPNLETLSIRAIDAISGSAAVSSTTPHPARKIRSFKLGDANSNGPYNFQEYSSVSDVQLAWLLEPSVSKGCLKELDIAIMVELGVGGGWPPGLPGGPGGNFGQNTAAPPFASSTIADLLIRCGGNLERLVLQDLGETGAVNPNFAAAPHNSNFDHVLSSLTSLRELSIQFSYTGTGFLASLSQIPHLRNLSLSGTPIHTSADLFADKLEHGLGELETLTISGQFAGMRGGQGGWNGAGVRKVKQAAKDRGLQGAFGG
ncbi:hypothetical protein JCM3765_006023 [Sporobolomyces pararoseus]